MNTFRKRCEVYRGWKKGYYQLASDGWQEGKLFNRTEQFVYGMATIGLMCLKFDIKIYAFTLMPNHIHLVLSGNGKDCVAAFDYFRRRTSIRLSRDGDAPLPPDYGFKLIPIENKQQMRNHVLYVFRNAYEKGWCTPQGYPWSSGWALFSPLAAFINGQRADKISRRKLKRLLGSHLTVPGNWEFHPALGLLPGSFVDNRLVLQLFPTVKHFQTQLVKDYESFSKIASDLGEDLSYTIEESRDIVTQLIQAHYGNKDMQQLTAEEKSLLAVHVYNTYHLPVPLIAEALSLQEKTVYQLVRSKDYGRSKPSGR